MSKQTTAGRKSRAQGIGATPNNRPLTATEKTRDAATLKSLPPEALIREPVLLQAFGGISRVCAWKWRQRGIIPKPVVIGRSNFWRVGDVLQALDALSTAPAVSA